jgi:hypothetical protein
VVFVVRLGALVEAIVVDASGARADPVRATALLAQAPQALPGNASRAVLEAALERAAPLLRSRLGAITDARWRAEDRARLSRRLIPLALTGARGAALRRDAAALSRMDGLISRLTCGMTAGEEVLLDELVEATTPLSVASLLAWHERLRPLDLAADPPQLEFVAALIVTGPTPR